MLSVYRGLALGVLLAGLGFMAVPTDAGAQDKKKDDKAKDFKGKVKLDDVREKKLSFPTCDRLTIQGYWFPAQKNTSDSVLMFPAPGKKINDDWIALAKVLSEQDFSVLLFDWRGCGLNGPDRGIRIFDDTTEFMRDVFNKKYANKTMTDKGMDYNLFTTRYRDSILYDLAGARFFLDKQNDDQKCNSSRIWIVSEGQGVDLGLAFIASESYRFSLFKGMNIGAIQDDRIAVKDYAGIVSLSYATSPIGNAVFNASFVNKGSSAAGKEGKIHFENRLAMVMLYGKKEGAGPSKGVVSKFTVGNEDYLKQRFKYMREIDNSKIAAPLTGAALLNAEDTLGTRDTIIKAMVEISKDKQDNDKGRTKRNAAEISLPPRFNIEAFKPN